MSALHFVAWGSIEYSSLPSLDQIKLIISLRKELQSQALPLSLFYTDSTLDHFNAFDGVRGCVGTLRQICQWALTHKIPNPGTITTSKPTPNLG